MAASVMTAHLDILDAVFGEESQGNSPKRELRLQGVSLCEANISFQNFMLGL